MDCTRKPEQRLGPNWFKHIFPKPRWLLENWIHEGELVMLTGRRKAFKSFWTTNFAISGVLGLPFLGRPTHFPANRPIILVQQEISDPQYQWRLKTQLAGRHSAWDRFIVFSTEGIRLSEKDDKFKELDETITRYNPFLIILDNLSKMYPSGFQPNDEVHAAEIMHIFRRWRNGGRTVLVVHHDGKPTEYGSSARGSSIWEDDPDGIIRLERDSMTTENPMVTASAILRHGSEPPRQTLYFNPNTLLLETPEERSNAAA